jgi:hypothetical protein
LLSRELTRAVKNEDAVMDALYARLSGFDKAAAGEHELALKRAGVAPLLGRGRSWQKAGQPKRQKKYPEHIPSGLTDGRHSGMVPTGRRCAPPVGAAPE